MTRPLQRLSAFIAAHAGLRMPDWVLEARVNEQMIMLQVSDTDDYVARVTSPEGVRELSLLMEALRVGETRFFRHAAQIRALTDEVIPALCRAASNRRLRAWSAGCATGEEAYTLALLLRRAVASTACTCQVLATDLSDDALAIARRGVYPEAALAQVPPALRSHSFVRCEDGWSVTDGIAKLVTFERHNLADSDYPSGFDLILCRNVLIYFEPAARQRVLTRLIDSLRPGGFLFVGYAESLRGLPALEVVHTSGGVLFRKPLQPHAPDRRTPAPVSPTPRVSTALVKAPTTGLESKRPAPLTVVTRPAATMTQVVSLRGSYPDGTRLSQELSHAIAGHHRVLEVHLDGAEYLCDEAAAVLRRARSAARFAGIELTLVATRPGIRRWLTRGGLTARTTARDGGDA